ncbi:LysM peptidoglycan-binding domain-containing protein [Bacillus sp. WMMC1349]|uniref:LysM peptidoglycan-binding domain-containing protein n=1 Tax=Bacillus sp. WMMC1349 TaxID=2736254 RepID=UPI0015565148|nr:LysM domain-containing protein [Bacillus sp. WMMC1349]NPC93327.1 LysM peptidoglycan-binding domain-containing protein [Bacillus sp. WMMC1349]
MKRLVMFLSILLTLFIIYYDLKTGTIPEQAIPVSARTKETIATDMIEYKTVTVQPGETVISITGDDMSTSRIINDFERLNPNVKARHIQAGVTYKFPVYPEKKR